MFFVQLHRFFGIIACCSSFVFRNIFSKKNCQIRAQSKVSVFFNRGQSTFNEKSVSSKILPFMGQINRPKPNKKSAALSQTLLI